ncbi:N-6 DNA methylase [Anaerolineales bacterium HSG25]|nr:N-6 DNA methylase [Anaerolineales bacterium HSG25]
MSHTITPKQFVEKWSVIQQKEIAVAQSHFFDVCALVNHPRPLDFDPTGKIFAFEATTQKSTGTKGRADVFYRDKFIWEYKGAYADLDKAFDQLNLYRDALGNPPLLITSDTKRIIIHTNFTNTVKQIHEIDFDSLLTGNGLKLLKRAFYNPDSFKPDQTQEQVTLATSKTFVKVAESLQRWAAIEGRTIDPEKLAHFIIRLLFCLFAEDMKLLPDHLFTKMISQKGHNFNDFVHGLRNLFSSMRDGGYFGFYRIPHFDGGLFDDDFVPSDPPSDIKTELLQSTKLDWSNIDPSIFGTLFERIIDESKRAKLGAHYTGKNDIMLIVQPVLMEPLRREWQAVKQKVNQLIKKNQPDRASTELQRFADRVGSIRVLDPACGSGNFLYVALQQLLNLQKEVIVMAKRTELAPIELTVSPAQLYGIEINPYAHELAQVTVWIGYIQWRTENGFTEITEPILQPLKNIENRDAILAYDDEGKPVEPEWPEADIVIGNPPFLGGKRLRTELGDNYIEALFRVYDNRVPHEADLVTYWFEISRTLIETGKLKRAGLLTTNSIRQQQNRLVLKRIKETGDIFMAWSDRPWILDGASVRVSMIGFDDGKETLRTLDSEPVKTINSDLTSALDLTIAQRLNENINISYMGDTKGGAFDISANIATKMLNAPINPNGRPNSDVVRSWINGLDITRHPRDMWIIDFGVMMPEEEAARYEAPFEYVQREVKPKRLENKRASYRKKWWIHVESRPAMREALKKLKRYIVTVIVAKHRLFAWVPVSVLSDHRLFVFARDDNYFFGVLHSKLHEVWALRMGSTLENRPSYSSVTCFETFPFPYPPNQEPTETENPHVAAIAQAARDLVEFRQSWLNPEGVGVTFSEKILKKRTLTNLYNACAHYRGNYKGKQHNQRQWKKEIKGIITLEDIETLDYIHTQLDQAVLDAYGWPHTLTDEQILERLLTLNLERAKQ